MITPKEQIKSLELTLLESNWTIWFDGKNFKSSNVKTNWLESLTQVAVFDTVETFWVIWSSIKKPSEINVGSTYCLFRKGLRPSWEDESNKNAGKWTALIDLVDGDYVWEETVLAVIGEQLSGDDTVIGLVLSKRYANFKLAVWTKNKEASLANLQVGVKLKEKLLLKNGSLTYIPLENYVKPIHSL